MYYTNNIQETKSNNFLQIIRDKEKYIGKYPLKLEEKRKQAKLLWNSKNENSIQNNEV